MLKVLVLGNIKLGSLHLYLLTSHWVGITNKKLELLTTG